MGCCYAENAPKKVIVIQKEIHPTPMINKSFVGSNDSFVDNSLNQKEYVASEIFLNQKEKKKIHKPSKNFFEDCKIDYKKESKKGNSNELKKSQLTAEKNMILKTNKIIKSSNYFDSANPLSYSEKPVQKDVLCLKDTNYSSNIINIYYFDKPNFMKNKKISKW